MFGCLFFLFGHVFVYYSDMNLVKKDDAQLTVAAQYQCVDAMIRTIQ